ncbi:MAG: hypothetical protein ACTSYJ_04975, partial [Candidatus Thorarchaeota archaeon]
MELQKNMRFVWEEKLIVYPARAEKFRNWNAMETREKTLKENIENLNRIKELAEKANEYGVLATDIRVCVKKEDEETARPENVEAFGFADGELWVRFERGDKYQVENLDLIEFLEELIEHQKTELQKHQEYMK